MLNYRSQINDDLWELSMVRCLAALLTVVFLSLPASAEDNAAAMEAIDNLVAKLDAAFEAQDEQAIVALTTDDHVSVTPYYGTPQTLKAVIQTLPDLKIDQTDLSEPTVVFLGPDGAMRQLTAKVEGTYGPNKISQKLFITSILRKQDGDWLESFYQATALAP